MEKTPMEASYALAVMMATTLHFLTEPGVVDMSRDDAYEKFDAIAERDAVDMMFELMIRDGFLSQGKAGRISILKRGRVVAMLIRTLREMGRFSNEVQK